MNLGTVLTQLSPEHHLREAARLTDRAASLESASRRPMRRRTVSSSELLAVLLSGLIDAQFGKQFGRGLQGGIDQANRRAISEAPMRRADAKALAQAALRQAAAHSAAAGWLGSDHL